MKKALIFILTCAALAIAAEEKVTIQIEGMTCGGCVNKVTTTLEQIAGVKSADVSQKPGSAAITYESDQADPEVMMSAIAGLGYKASMASLTAGEATHCADEGKKEVQAEAAVAESKQAALKPGCAMASTCKKAGSKPACATPATSVKEESSKPSAGHTESGHDCPTLSQCKDLIEFHDTMHPLHLALSEGQFQVIRDGFPKLAEKADAVKAMKCDKSCVTDVEKFEKIRLTLLESVDELGTACKTDDDENLTRAFDKMHASYVELGKLAK